MATNINAQGGPPPTKDDEKLGDEEVAVAEAPTQQQEQPQEIDHKYLAASRSTRFYRGVLFQMILFGALAFVGPAMNDAISNLGGGGLSTPYLANLANTLNYTTSCLLTLFGGPLINKIGIKWACIIAAIFMPLGGSGYYVSARFNVDWFLLLARAIGGISGGFLYVGESTAMLSYPDANDRGLYLGIWAAMRNSGSVVGGAINFSTNHATATAGGIAWSTYLIFIGFECTGWIYGLLLSPTRKVRRKTGVPVPCLPSPGWKHEMIAWWKHLKSKRTMLMFLPAFYSFFCGGVMGTYLSLNFSVRARALSSLLTPSISIITVLLYGRGVMDNTRFSQKTRAYIGFALWGGFQAVGLIWVGIESYAVRDGRMAWDYGTHGGRWAQAYIPYLFVFVTCYWCQLHLYWMLGTFSINVNSSSRTGGLFRAFETAGQAVSYGINANSVDRNVPIYVQAALLVACSVPMIGLIRMVPEKPVDHDDVADEKPVAVTAKALE